MKMTMKKLVLSSLACSLFLAAGGARAEAIDTAVPRYDHILVIIGENQSYGPIISGESTPNLKRLAETYGLATNFFAEAHPSEGNYVAMLGGSTFGIHDDDAFTCRQDSKDRYCSKADAPHYADHTVRKRSLIDQLEEHHLSWKGYFQDIPQPGSLAIRAPDPDALRPGEMPALYAAKHNGFITFERVQKDPKRAKKIVGFDQLTRDLASGQVPAFAHIVPNQCDDMHGLSGDSVPADCKSENEAARRTRGDAAIARLVDQIQRSPIWRKRGNTAIVITFDEDGKPRDPADAQGCCGYQPDSAADFGGGHIATLVIANHGPRGLTDPTPYNHYSLLRTTEDAFGIGEHLNHAADTGSGVVPMTRLFAVTK
jgi:phosphatidylinositol-3-phosphatase